MYGCTSAQQLWIIAMAPSPTMGVSTILEYNLSYVLDLMTDSELTWDVKMAIPWVLWHVWKNRNSILFAQKQEALSSVIQKAFEEATLWREVNKITKESQHTSLKIPSRAQRWHPPLLGMIKCNLNYNWINASLHSGGAWVTRDHIGSVMHHAREAFTCSPSMLISELQCVIWAIQSLQDLWV